MKNIALVTGASGTIGSAIAKHLLLNNIEVIMQYHQHLDRIKEIEQQFINHQVRLWTIQADLSTIEGINNLFLHIARLGLHPSILINAAGISHYGLIQDVSFKEWQKVIHSHVLSAYFCSQKVIPEMIKNKYGRIVNISSIWGEKGAANEVLYSMAKGAINTFTKALAKELAPSGITVNAIAPGIVMSDMMANFSQLELEEMKKEIPLQRFASPSEIAEWVYHFLDSNSAYVTGQIIHIDGGWN
ncbi:SDR family oxidoreductase [Tepidibacillus infernus]|uniref:3-ketoacyl-ACP reductase n=1 Tax=Tepidibacillus decaturensis TaxID=1413211 RepID=A0A135L3K0_9BACI|nr:MULTISPECIES: SDR family oxidoreductase [Tepidibacillus]KXG43449.1 hypothetical protein U473_05060 [Tepidibacillus decaturensis]GBF11313.1 3-oxoacyl-[acyl-carrier-protein] reductase FabG [Tepidibacillus sp. HK-1]